MIYVFLNIYEDKDSGRNQELIKCREFLELSPFIYIIPVSGRPTFADFFQVINKHLPDDSVVAIINSDIFFDETIALAENIGKNEVYALSRWDIQKDGRAIPFHRADSQDVWIFRTPVKEIKGADFSMGRAGCDNKIALLFEQAGYKVTNPCKSIHAFHLHLSGVRNYIEKGKVIDRIPPPYKLVAPSEL